VAGRGGNRLRPYEERTVDLTPEVVHALERHVRWLKEGTLRRG
jgi:hypothetical protein